MKIGEIAELGWHRLMCGDATNRDDVMKLIDGETVDLVLTDPPYGILVVDRKRGTIGGSTSTGFSGKTSKVVEARQYSSVIGDYTTDMAEENYRILRSICKNMIIWGGQNFTRFLPPSCGWIFWDKEKGTDKLSFSDGELAWANILTKVKKYSHKWNGFVRAGDKTLNEKIHPTQKPVELHMKILEDFSKPGDVILDCFGGSGTTLIACEMTGRKCLMMEISPEYCDIIKTRYEKLTEGKLPLEV